MKNYSLNTLSENNIKNFPVQNGKIKFLDLKINTNNNENLSPNNKIPESNVPSTARNFNLKIDSNYITNKLPLSGSISNRNSDNNMEKKLFKIMSVAELNKKKNEMSRTKLIKNSDGGKEPNYNGTIEEKKANLDRVKISHKNFGIIEAYSAITTEGLYR